MVSFSSFCSDVFPFVRVFPLAHRWIAWRESAEWSVLLQCSSCAPLSILMKNTIIIGVRTTSNMDLFQAFLLSLFIFHHHLSLELAFPPLLVAVLIVFLPLLFLFVNHLSTTYHSLTHWLTYSHVCCTNHQSSSGCDYSTQNNSKSDFCLICRLFTTPLEMWLFSDPF